MDSKSPKWGYSPSKQPKWLINGGYYLLTNWDDPPSRNPTKLMAGLAPGILEQDRILPLKNELARMSRDGSELING